MMEFRAGDVVNYRGLKSKFRVLSVAGDFLKLESESGVKQSGMYPSSSFDIVRRVVHVGDVLVGTGSREASERIHLEPRMPEVAVANATAPEPAFTAGQWARHMFDADPIVHADIRRHADVEDVHRETTTALQYEGRPRVDVLDIRVDVTDRVRAALDRAWEKDIGGRRTYWTKLCEQAVGR